MSSNPGGRPATPAYQRIMAAAQRQSDGCLVLHKGAKQHGYTRIWQLKTRRFAHVWVLLHHTGLTEPPADKPNALHSCHNRACVEPTHLRWGTHRDNAQDRMQAGRSRTWRMADNPNTKLTDQQVRAIRADPRTQTLIASEYGITQAAVSAIKRRVTWGWLP